MKIYNFKITSKQNGQVAGTGSFKVSKEMTPEEQLNFFHQYTSGHYQCSENYFKIEIY